MVIPNGMIEIDSDFAKEIGFTSDKFFGYLWGFPETKRIIISNIESLYPEKGNLRTLFINIEKVFNTIEVPCPSNRMKEILEKNGYNFIGGEHEVWIKEVTR